MNRTKGLWVLCLVLGLAPACSVLRGPAGFWKSFHSDLIRDRYSDHGPWGGDRWLLWKSELPGTFTVSAAQGFAELHGWRLLKEQAYAPNQPADESLHQGEQNGPRFLPVQSTILLFDSQWVRVKPGAGEGSIAIGYVQVSSDGREMYVYHFWGEG